MQWSKREKWFGHKELVQTAQALKIEKQGMSAVVSKSASDVFLQYKGKTKLFQAKAVYKTAKHFSKLQPEVLATKTVEVKNNVDSGAKLWPEESQQPLTQVNVNVSGVRLPDSQM